MVNRKEGDLQTITKKHYTYLILKQGNPLCLNPEKRPAVCVEELAFFYISLLRGEILALTCPKGELRRI